MSERRSGRDAGCCWGGQTGRRGKKKRRRNHSPPNRHTTFPLSDTSHFPTHHGWPPPFNLHTPFATSSRPTAPARGHDNWLHPQSHTRDRTALFPRRTRLTYSKTTKSQARYEQNKAEWAPLRAQASILWLARWVYSRHQHGLLTIAGSTTCRSASLLGAQAIPGPSNLNLSVSVRSIDMPIPSSEARFQHLGTTIFYQVAP